MQSRLRSKLALFLFLATAWASPALVVQAVYQVAAPCISVVEILAQVHGTLEAVLSRSVNAAVGNCGIFDPPGLRS